MKRLFIVLLFYPCLTGCLTVPRDATVLNEAAAASVPEFPNARFNADDPTLAGRLETDMRATAAKTPATGPYQILALSGGGADGAFGAGVLIGWTKRGDRPQFNVVTGVSTGALIAPFAFLGPEYDARLRDAYTSGAAAEPDAQTRALCRFYAGYFPGRPTA